VDAPCSGLGILAKKPDIRQKTRKDFENLPEIQRRILQNGARYVKPGGVLVYATCTLNLRENEDVAKVFLKENPDFSFVRFRCRRKFSARRKKIRGC
jgi:16S rRNA (cytosine967-C5)-methyltransferase